MEAENKVYFGPKPNRPVDEVQKGNINDFLGNLRMLRDSTR